MLLEKKYYEALDKIIIEKEVLTVEALIKRVHVEIEKLPPKCKEVFLLSRKEGLTNVEIAEYMELSIKSVEAHITKAFNILRASLGDKMHEMLFLLFSNNKQ